MVRQSLNYDQKRVYTHRSCPESRPCFVKSGASALRQPRRQVRRPYSKRNAGWVEGSGSPRNSRESDREPGSKKKKKRQKHSKRTGESRLARCWGRGKRNGLEEKGLQPLRPSAYISATSPGAPVRLELQLLAHINNQVPLELLSLSVDDKFLHEVFESDVLRSCATVACNWVSGDEGRKQTGMMHFTPAYPKMVMRESIEGRSPRLVALLRVFSLKEFGTQTTSACF